jgi:hypothetical protein|tara:strand:- start:2745 stop:2990 length:246 start_codon:yes stop_codon:yes gene_type:complete
MIPAESNVRSFATRYLWHKAIADQEKARLSLELLTNNAVGIGDHSTGDFHKNLDEALDALIDARDRLELLGELYPELEEYV